VKVLDKAAAVAIAKKTKYTSAEYEDVKVAVFGNTVIATGGFNGKGTIPRVRLLIRTSAGPTRG
jgi:hypothetical protein